MAHLSSNLIGLHRFRPCFQIRQTPQSIANPLQRHNKTQKFKTLASQTNPNLDESSTAEKLVVKPSNCKGTGSPKDAPPKFASKDIKKKIAIVSTLAALGLFLCSRLYFGVSLKDHCARALPHEETLSNGKPSAVEFYVDGCEVCQELAPEVDKVEQQHKGQAKFVMLNVDNIKWEQELDEFGVEGIPHLCSRQVSKIFPA